MKLRTILSAILVMSVAFVRADEKPDPAKTFRNITVSVPKLKKAPTIDGTVDAAEWADATMAPRFVLLDDGNGNDQLLGEEKKIYWGYTDDAFYLAFQLQRPGGIPPAATVTKRDLGYWHVDDALELHLNNIPTRNDRPITFCRDYYFQWNALGTKYDRTDYLHGRAQSVRDWDPEWDVTCRVVPGYGWEGEVRVPFKAFANNNVPPPKPGDIWYCNLLENIATPNAYLANSAFSLAWSAQRDYQSLIFLDANAVYARVLDVGSMRKEHKQGIKLELVNPSASAQNVSVGIKLYKQKPDAPSKISYLRAFDQSRDRPEDLAGKGKAPLFLSDEKVSEGILKENYDLKQELKEEVSLAANERKQLAVAPEAEPGTYVVMYDVGQGDDPKTRKVLAGAALPFVVPDKMDIKTSSYVLSDASVQTQIELEFIPDWKGKGTITAQVKAGNGKVVIDKKWSEAKYDNILKFDVPVKGFPAGEYRMEVVAKDEAGKELAKRDVPIRIPEIPKWFTEKVGLTPTIPEPYQAIKVGEAGSGKKLSFLMGEYELKDSVLASSVRVRSIHETERKDLLRGPIQLKAKVNGKEVVVSGAVKVNGAKPEVVECQSSAQAEGLAVSMTGAFEYDGMEKVTLKVGPAVGTVSVEALWLEIPMKKEYSVLANGLGDLTGGPVSLAQGLAPWTVPAEGVKLPFHTMIALGDEERRFVWFAENCKGWKLDGKAAKEAIEVTRDTDGAATIRINLIKWNNGYKLEKERQIVFGLMFTPARTIYPKLVRHGATGKGDAIVGDGRDCDMFSTEQWYFYSYRGKTAQEGIQDYQGWPEFKAEDSNPETVKRRDFGQSVGVKILPYTGWFLHRRASVYPIFGSEMVTSPLVDGGCGADVCCWNSPVQDVFVSLLKDRILDAKIDGFRFDAGYTDVFPCNSLKHHAYGSTCGWIDDDGNVQSSVPIFAARKAAERTYRIFHGGVHKDGLCIQGRTPAKVPPIWSFFDAGLTSEGMDTKIKTIKELPLVYYRANQMGDAYGVPVVYMPKCEWTGLNSRLGISILHNNPPRGGGSMVNWEISTSRSANATVGIWKLVGRWAKWPDPKTEFWGYWKNGQLAETSNDDLKASFYVRRGERILLGVMNLDRKPAEGSVTLNLAELGFKQAFAQDGFTGEDIAIDQGALKLDFLPESYRLVKITATKPVHGLPQITGDNLLADADPAKWPTGKAPAGWNGTAQVENNNLVMNDGGSVLRGFRLQKDKQYLLQVEARVECADGIYLGESPVTDQFSVVVHGGNARWMRTIGSQSLPGRYETLRLIIDKPAEEASVGLALKGKGRALIRAMSLHAIQPYTKPYEEN